MLPKFTRGRPERITTMAEIKRNAKQMNKLERLKASGILDIKSKKIHKKVEVKDKKKKKKEKQ